MASIPLVDLSEAQGRLQSLPLRLFLECHVEVAVILLPPLVLLDGKAANEAQATRLIGKDPRQPRAAPNLLVEALAHVGRLHVAMMRQWQPIAGQRLLDVVLDPSDELGVAGLPLLDPCLDVGLGLFELVAIVKPYRASLRRLVAFYAALDAGRPELSWHLRLRQAPAAYHRYWSPLQASRTCGVSKEDYQRPFPGQTEQVSFCARE